jgi:hypothetical protein
LVRPLCAALVVLGVLAFVGIGEETTVPDEIIRDLATMPDGTLPLMHEFVSIADELLETDPETRSAMLADPRLWFETEHSVVFEDAMLWAVDLAVPSEGEEAWLYVSEYLGDAELLDVGIGLTGPDLTLFIQTAAGEEVPDAITQRVLGVIGGRPEEEWNALRDIALDANLPGISDLEIVLKQDTRQALINQGQRLSSQSTRLIVIDHAAGIAANALFMPEPPFGMIRAPQAITLFGESVLLIYNSMF